MATDLLTEVFADSIRLDFVCGAEVYGSCTQLREYLERHDQGYVLIAWSGRAFPSPQSAAQLQASCPAADQGAQREVLSADQGFKGNRWYA